VFDSFTKSEPSILAFAVMQFSVPLCGFLSMALVRNPFDTPYPNASVASRIACALVYAVSALLSGTVVAIATRRILHEQTFLRWIWVIPGLIVLLGLIWESTLFGFQKALSEFFLPPSGSEEWLLFVLLTSPTIACISYSTAFRFLTKSSIR